MWRRLYFLPILITTPVKGFHGAREGYDKYKSLSLGGHVFGCFINTYGGVIEGAFLGVVWPISGFVLVKRYLEK